MKLVKLSFIGEHGTCCSVFFMGWLGSAWGSYTEARKELGPWKPGQVVWANIICGGECEARA